MGRVRFASAPSRNTDEDELSRWGRITLHRGVPAEAWKIKLDDTLMSCVVSQCGVVEVTCSEWSRKQCKELSERRGGVTLAFTSSGRETTWYNPVNEIHWCEGPESHACIVKSVIHELAHSCGWDHGRNPTVPGNEEFKPPCECTRDNPSAGVCQ
jgi:hypothetical protein